MMLMTLVEIANMTDPEDIEEDEDGFTEWGCGATEAVEMAYENCITLAQIALGNLSEKPKS